jgi:hypothetical protein
MLSVVLLCNMNIEPSYTTVGDDFQIVGGVVPFNFNNFLNVTADNIFFRKWIATLILGNSYNSYGTFYKTMVFQSTTVTDCPSSVCFEADMFRLNPFTPYFRQLIHATTNDYVKIYRTPFYHIRMAMRPVALLPDTCEMYGCGRDSSNIACAMNNNSNLLTGTKFSTLYES